MHSVQFQCRTVPFLEKWKESLKTKARIAIRLIELEIQICAKSVTMAQLNEKWRCFGDTVVRSAGGSPAISCL
jgi:hypothetical protein